MAEENPRWNFERIGPNGYEEEGVAAFEVFNQQDKLDPLEVLVRESIQNSCDARVGTDAVRVEFELRELHDGDADAFLHHIGFDSLEPHLRGTAEQTGSLQSRIERQGLADQVDKRRLRVMTIADFGTTGLWGEEGVDEPAEGNFHKLVRAAMKTHEEGDSTKGGSFGLGKAIYWMTSGLATVVLHSIPFEGPNRGQSRLIGRSWLPSHTTTIGNVSRRWNNVGGWFGEQEAVEESVTRSISMWGGHASALAEQLGLAREAGETGTSFAIIAFDDPEEVEEPDVADICAGLCRHVKKWYWPALCEGKLQVVVSHQVGEHEPEGTELRELAEDDPDVGQFVRAWNALNADAPSVVSDPDFASEDLAWRLPARKKDPQHDEITETVKIGMVLTPEEEPRGETSNTVALMRGGTGMVVQYYKKDGIARLYQESGRSFYGVLRTSLSEGQEAEKLEMFLRATEPPAHDRWSASQERVRQEYHWKGGGSLTATQALRTYFEDIERFLRSEVEEPVPDGARGPDRLLKLLNFGGSGIQTPTSPKLIVQSGHATGLGGHWTFEGASFGLNSGSSWDDSEYEWGFEISVTVPEDGRMGKLALPISSFAVKDGNGEAADFRDGDTIIRVQAKPGVDRVSFDLSADLPTELTGNVTRTNRVAAQLTAALIKGGV